MAEDRHRRPAARRRPAQTANTMKRIAVHRQLLALLLVLSAASSYAADDAENPRETPVVRAVRIAKSSVVNIHSEKTASDEDSLFGSAKGRKINGMGTGIVVDERGYIVTNHHVVDGVDSLRVTLVDGSTFMARVVSTDRTHDLAVIKVEPSEPLDVMPLGTSSDLMLGETVIAVGNAFGYEHTVTRGIVSALGRDVEVNETQRYENLIQTDASINPGNSGGPLVSLEGRVVGINVAIRAGAQRIGFAIPIDDARRVIARLISSERISHTFHGIRTRELKSADGFSLVAETPDSRSPAGAAGIASGDVIRRVGGVEIDDRVDLERALIGRKVGEEVEFEVDRNGESQVVTVVLSRADVQLARDNGRNEDSPVARANNDVPSEADRVWEKLGLRLNPSPVRDRAAVGPRYRGGLRVLEVRSGSPAARNGIRRGDLLVGLHVWEMINRDNVDYVLDHPKLKTFNPLKFYIIRNRETLYGHLRLVSAK